MVRSVNDIWIIDSSASNHMTTSLDSLSTVTHVTTNSVITLPTIDATLITHTVDLVLNNGLTLTKVLYIPQSNTICYLFINYQKIIVVM